MRQTVRYAARTTATEWTCEWRIPRRDAGVGPDGQLPANIGIHITATKTWLGWVATGGPFFNVHAAGRMLLGK
jgi:hypothetical protein